MASIPRDVLLSRKANNLVPISSLPNELLIVIFKLVLDCSLLGYGNRWLKILHVCHRWYNVGVNTPSLWTTVRTYIGGIQCVKEFMRRSRGLPLDVLAHSFGPVHPTDDVRKDMERYAEVASIVLENTPRIRSLNGTSYHDYWKKAEAQRSHDLLEELTFLIRGHPDSGQLDVNTVWLLSSGPPRLRRLDIELFDAAYGVIRAPALRVLEISTACIDGYYDPRDLLESMRHMPLLEEVTLSAYCVDRAFAYETSLELPVDLPRLKLLTVINRAPIVRYFLKHITHPATASLSIGCEVTDTDDVDDTMLDLREWLVAVPFADIDHTSTLSIKSTVDFPGINRCLQIEACTHGHDCLCPTYEPGQWRRTLDGPLMPYHRLHSERQCRSPDISLTLMYEVYNNTWHNLYGFTDMLALFPLHQVELLRIESRDAYNSLKAHLGFIDDDVVADAPVPLDGVHHFAVPPVAAPSELSQPLFELEPGLRPMMPNLAAICLDLSPQERSLRSDLDNPEVRY